MDWNDKTNKELAESVIEMQKKHNSLRLALLEGMDILVALEKECLKAVEVLNERGVNL